MAIFNNIKIETDSKHIKRNAVDIQTDRPAEFWLFNNLKFGITLLSNGVLFSDFNNVSKLVLGIKACDNGGYPLDVETFEILKEVEAEGINTTLTEEQQASGGVHATFEIEPSDISATMKSGLKWLVVQAVDSDGGQLTFFGGNIICKNDASNGTASGETLTRFQSFQTACENAKSDAEDAATTATAKASEAGESASAAAASADAASISAQDANNAKNTAVEAKEAASSFAGDCAGYVATASTKATQAITAATEAATSSSFAAEVSRIAIVPITATSQTIQPNKCYTLATNDVDSYTLTPQMPAEDPEYLLQAIVQITTGATAPTITWAGVEHFFNNKIPTIDANSSYNIYYEFDNLRLAWVVGVIKK